ARSLQARHVLAGATRLFLGFADAFDFSTSTISGLPGFYADNLGSLTAEFSISTQTCVQPPPGMVAWWPGDGDARDLVGTNHGSIVGNVTFEQGLVGQAFSFDGTSGSVNVTNTS